MVDEDTAGTGAASGAGAPWQHVDLVTLAVSDVGAARSFYSGGLGWQPVLDLPEVVFYQVGHGVALALWGVDDLATDVGTPVAMGTSVVLAINLPSADDVAWQVQRWRAAGGTVLVEPRAAVFGGRQAYVADPDGNRWEIAWNPGWYVAPDGRVSLTGPGD